MSFDRDILTRLIAAHGSVARIVVLDTKGSAPRDAGTAMYVWADGQEATIGGGTLEYQAVAEARRLLEANAAPSVQVKPLGPALGQCCGGSVTLLYERFDAASLPAETDHTYLRRVTADATKTPPAKCMKTDVSSPVFADGWVAEVISPTRLPVWIFGGGHVGRALAAVLAPLPDFDVTVIDISAERMPDIAGTTPLIATDPTRLVPHAPATAHHFVMTHSHALDLELCHALLNQRTARIGLIGSATKWARFRKRLMTLGHDPATIARITCPIGDPALGKHPQEIAIGVAQSLVRARAADDLKEIAS